MNKCDYDEAVKKLIKAVVPTGTETVGIEDAFGRILCRDIIAEENVPSYERSPYDGYAFIASDTKGADDEHPLTLTVTEEIRAGKLSAKPLQRNTAVRLMTGAAIPEGADAVCKYEDTDFTDTTVTLKREYSSGENVIRAGEDIKKGSICACKGTAVDAGISGILSGLGISRVGVYKKVSAGVISTGDEVVDTGVSLLPGMIRNSNRYIMSAALEAIGISAVYLGHARDDVKEISGLIEKGLSECDIIVSTGGVSVGDYDLVPEAMEKSGMEILVHGVNIKPGMACAYGTREGRVMLALSGNPASSLTNLQCVCYPALRKLAGLKEYEHRMIPMTLSDGWSKKSRGLRLLRGRLDLSEGKAVLCPSKTQGNAVISSASGCNAYGLVPEGRCPLNAGDVIEGFIV